MPVAAAVWEERYLLYHWDFNDAGKEDDVTIPEPEDLLEIIDAADGYRRIDIIKFYRNTDCSIFVLQSFLMHRKFAMINSYERKKRGVQRSIPSLS